MLSKLKEVGSVSLNFLKYRIDLFFNFFETFDKIVKD
jgi:hypothetical protein